MGRKLRSINDALIPKVKVYANKFPISLTSCEVGSPVFARDYRTGHSKWIDGLIMSRHGNMMYDVAVRPET